MQNQKKKERKKSKKNVEEILSGIEIEIVKEEEKEQNNDECLS